MAIKRAFERLERVTWIIVSNEATTMVVTENEDRRRKHTPRVFRDCDSYGTLRQLQRGPSWEHFGSEKKMKNRTVV